MPELPEVETIVRGLRAALTGKRIAGARVFLRKMAVTPGSEPLEQALAGDRIVAVARRGKYAVLALETGRRLVISLRMTGRLVVQKRGDPPYPYGHVVAGFFGCHASDVCRRAARSAGCAWWRRASPGTQSWASSRFLRLYPEPLSVCCRGGQRRSRLFSSISGASRASETSTPAKRFGRPGFDPSRPAQSADETGDSPVASRASSTFWDARSKCAGQQRRRLRGCRRPPGGFQNVLSVYGKTRHGDAPGARSRSFERCSRQRGTWWCRHVPTVTSHKK